LVAPDWIATGVGLVLVAPVVVRQSLGWGRREVLPG